MTSTTSSIVILPINFPFSSITEDEIKSFLSKIVATSLSFNPASKGKNSVSIISRTIMDGSEVIIFPMDNSPKYSFS